MSKSISVFLHSFLYIFNTLRGGGHKTISIGFLAFLLAANFSSSAQNSCVPFKFEITMVAPDVNVRTSTAAKPGAYQFYYKVSLVANGSTLPPTISLRYINFSGLVKINKFTSTIDVGSSYLYTANQALMGSNVASLFEINEGGEVTWGSGTAVSSCSSQDGNSSILTGIPLGQNVKNLPLFTVVVNASPGDVIDFVDISTVAQACFGMAPNFTFCNATVPFTSQTPLSKQYTMPAPPVCNPSVKYDVEAKDILGLSFFEASVINTSGQIITKNDGVLRITSNLSNLDYDISPPNVPNPPIIVHKKRKNPDGSIDFFFTIDLTVQSTPNPMFRIFVKNVTNSILKTDFTFTFLYGRAGMLNGSVCSMLDTPPKTIAFPGFPVCNQELKMTLSPHYGNDCQLGVKFTFTHNALLPIQVNAMKLNFTFPIKPGNSIAPPITGLPCPGCLTYGQVNTSAYLRYENYTPFELVSGTTLIVPFNVNQDCISPLIFEALIEPLGSSECGIWVPNLITACSPEIVGSVKLSNGKDAPLYQVALEKQAGGNWNQTHHDDEFCKGGFNFCDPPTTQQRRLIVNAHPEVAATSYKGCGSSNSEVTTYDLVFLGRDIAWHAYHDDPNNDPNAPGAPPADWNMTSPVQFLAANVHIGNMPSPNGIEEQDISKIRQCILGATLDFGNSPGVPSWYYLRHDYVFPSTNPNTLVTQVMADATANVSTVPANGLGNYGKFAAIKVGDMNLSCDCDTYEKSSSAKDAGLTVQTSAIRREQNKLRIPIYAQQAYRMIAVQAGIKFDQAALRFVKLLPNVDARIGEEHFGLTDIDKGVIRFGWSSVGKMIPLNINEHLFTLEFEVIDEANLSEGRTIWSSDDALDCLSYQENGKEDRFAFDWAYTKVSDNHIEASISPNPVSDLLYLYLHNGVAIQDVHLEILDVSGRIIANQTTTLAIGDNLFDLDQSAQPSGAYTLRIKSSEGIITRTYIKQ